MALVGLGFTAPARAADLGVAPGHAEGGSAAAADDLVLNDVCTSPSSVSESSSEDEVELPRPGISCSVCMTATVGNTGLPLDTSLSADDRGPHWDLDTASRRRRVQAETKALAILAKRAADRQPISHAGAWAVVSPW